MKKILFTMLIVLTVNGSYAADPLMIEKQGSFSVGGKIIKHDGKYDNSKFVG